MKKYSVSEFANEVRNKYPDVYDDLSDEKLIEFWIKKFPNDKNKIKLRNNYFITLLLLLSFIFSFLSIFAFFYYSTQEYKEVFGRVTNWISSQEFLQENSAFQKTNSGDINEYDNATNFTNFLPMINCIILSFFYFLVIIKNKEGILNWWSFKLTSYILISIFIFYVTGFISPHFLLDNYPKQIAVLLFFDLIHNYYFTRSLLELPNYNSLKSKLF